MNICTNNGRPRVSVIMGIYNCTSTLTDAIECIQSQSFSDWELILCDDGSSDNTYEIALGLAEQDSRIIVLRNPENMGLNFTLNHCLKYAKGEFIARMDGDDLCLPERFIKQLFVFETHPEIAIVSSNMNYFDENGVWGTSTSQQFPRDMDFIYGTPFCHAASMVRKCAFDEVDGYSVSSSLLRVEDYHLWVKMYAKGYKGYNIEEPLYLMRDDRRAFARRKFKYRFNEVYVKYYAIRELQIPFLLYPYVLKPILVGILPNFLYKLLHKYKLRSINR